MMNEIREALKKATWVEDKQLHTVGEQAGYDSRGYIGTAEGGWRFVVAWFKNEQGEGADGTAAKGTVIMRLHPELAAEAIELVRQHIKDQP